MECVCGYIHNEQAPNIPKADPSVGNHGFYALPFAGLWACPVCGTVRFAIEHMRPSNEGNNHERNENERLGLS